MKDLSEKITLRNMTTVSPHSRTPRSPGSGGRPLGLAHCGHGTWGMGVGGR